jgi:putative protease
VNDLTLTPGIRKAEVLAPAGDWDALKAAVWSGADAVYFGLDEGFNCRARAANFPRARLAEIVAFLHRSNVRANLTVNTLVFEPELPVVLELLAFAIEKGVDALIVQDPAVALLARALHPGIRVHASTQMTISSAGGLRFARDLSVNRVVLPRELTLNEVSDLRKQTDLELEVFVHGALCVSYSGQCLTSEVFGQRSANRGQCAQSCRMPYELLVDGVRKNTGDIRYLLSPKDQAALESIPSLLALGVESLKIEGRQKNAHYVATAVRTYRAWVDHLQAGGDEQVGLESLLPDFVKAMGLAYSRGFSPGFLAGVDHQALVEGRFPKHRGFLLGQVARIHANKVLVDPLRPGRGSEQRLREDLLNPLLAPEQGMGVVFDQGDPESKHEPGGPIFATERDGERWWLKFGSPGPDLQRVRIGDLVWMTKDPTAESEVAHMKRQGEPEGRHPVRARISGRLGEPLHVQLESSAGSVSAESQMPLSLAKGEGLGDSLLREKLFAFGGTPFALSDLDGGRLGSGLYLPTSELKRLRRDLTAQLLPLVERIGARIPDRRAAHALLSSVGTVHHGARSDRAVVIPLCRNEAQLRAVIAAGLLEVELDWMELTGQERALRTAREAGLKVHLATLRIERPLEEHYSRHFRRMDPDGVLLRHWGGVMDFQEARSAGVELHGDFSLNVTNSLTAQHLLRLGLKTLTPSHDLDHAQLLALVERVDPTCLSLVVHHRVAMFHNEHCLYAHTLSDGADFRTCGRPCDRHEVSLQDHLNRIHPVIVDAGCRNTVFHHEVQTLAPWVPDLLERGVRRFRVEFVRETGEEALLVLRAYRQLLEGRKSALDLMGSLGVRAQQGLSGGAVELMV